MAQGSIVVVSKGESILLSCLQVLEYLVPILFFGIKLFLNKKKQNGYLARYGIPENN